MLTRLLNLFGPKRPSYEIGQILAFPNNKDQLLGVKQTDLPTPEKIIEDTTRLARYSQSQDYKVFCDEAWARILASLDIILDDKTSEDKVKFHRGVVKATLDLLRVSYQARLVKESLEKEKADVPSSR